MCNSWEVAWYRDRTPRLGMRDCLESHLCCWLSSWPSAAHCSSLSVCVFMGEMMYQPFQTNILWFLLLPFLNFHAVTAFNMTEMVKMHRHSNAWESVTNRLQMRAHSKALHSYVSIHAFLKEAPVCSPCGEGGPKGQPSLGLRNYMWWQQGPRHERKHGKAEE